MKLGGISAFRCSFLICTQRSVLRTRNVPWPVIMPINVSAFFLLSLGSFDFHFFNVLRFYLTSEYPGRLCIFAKHLSMFAFSTKLHVPAAGYTYKALSDRSFCHNGLSSSHFVVPKSFCCPLLFI